MSKEKITHNFQRKYTFEERVKESKSILEKYPDRVPIIVEIAENSKKKLKLDKKKYLVPKDLFTGEFLYICRKRLKIGPQEALFIFTTNNVILSSSKRISDLYEEYKNKCGFVYLTLATENTFGL